MLHAVRPFFVLPVFLIALGAIGCASTSGARTYGESSSGGGLAVIHEPAPWGTTTLQNAPSPPEPRAFERVPREPRIFVRREEDYCLRCSR